MLDKRWVRCLHQHFYLVQLSPIFIGDLIGFGFGRKIHLWAFGLQGVWNIYPHSISVQSMAMAVPPDTYQGASQHTLFQQPQCLCLGWWVSPIEIIYSQGVKSDAMPIKRQPIYYTSLANHNQMCIYIYIFHLYIYIYTSWSLASSCFFFISILISVTHSLSLSLSPSSSRSISFSRYICWSHWYFRISIRLYLSSSYIGMCIYSMYAMLGNICPGKLHDIACKAGFQILPAIATGAHAGTVQQPDDSHWEICEWISKPWLYDFLLSLPTILFTTIVGW